MKKKTDKPMDTELRHQAETSALLEASRAILKHREFKETARSIFDSCKNLTGATGGYVAMTSEDGTGFDLLFLDPGGRACTVDSSLPMPIRGLRGEAYRTSKAVYHNDFANSEYVKYVPEGHVTLDNILFTPLVIEGKMVGLLGLANKPGGFTENDAHLASVFGELVAIALLNSRTLETLKHSEERFRSVALTASDAIISADSQGRIIFWNNAAQAIFGWQADEMIGKPASLIIPERLREALQKGMQRVALMGEISIIGKTVESVGLRKDGTEFPIELSQSKWQTDKGTFFTAIIRDITERKQAEEALRKAHDTLKQRVQERTAELAQANETLKASEASLANAQRVAHIGNWDWNIQTNELRWSDEIYCIFGLSPQEFDSTYETFLSFIHPADVEFIKQSVAAALNERKHYSIDHRIVQPDRTERIVHEEAEVTFDDNGKPILMVGTVQDITERKQEEEKRKKLEAQLQLAQKMEAIGILAGGIAHDFNNILAAIIGYTELSMDEVPEESQVHSDLSKIMKAGYRARDLVNQILTFSRQREQEKKPIMIAPIVKESLKLLRASLPSTVEIRQNIESEPGMVLADPTQIHQVIMNLCTNAGYAMREKGGILEVSLTGKELDSEFCLQHPGLVAGPYMKLMVSDTGAGIAPDILPRIFEPYFTTKEKSGGTGLGLSVVHGIVTGFGGAVTVYSEPGKGTTFKVYLPVTTEELVAEVEKTKSVAKGHERILLIDDEQDIVDVGKRILENLGYTVTTMTSSMEALELFQKEPYQFDLVITDMTMPFMTGDELAQEFMRIRQDIPVVICTGYSEKLTEEKALRIGIRAYLGKPLLKSEMAETVRRVLDRQSEDI